MGEYGAQFWLNAGNPIGSDNRPYPNLPDDMFSANGFNEQRVFIFPSHDLVVVRLGHTEHDNFDFGEFLEAILESIE